MAGWLDDIVAGINGQEDQDKDKEQKDPGDQDQDKDKDKQDPPQRKSRITYSDAFYDAFPDASPASGR